MRKIPVMLYIINLLILIIVNVIFSDSGSDVLGRLIGMALAIGLHVAILIGATIAKFSNGDRTLGKHYLLNVFMVLILGFSSCTMTGVF